MQENLVDLMDDCQELARAWVTARLNSDDTKNEDDVKFIYREMLHPYMVKHGSAGGLALCEALVVLCAHIADIASVELDISAQELIQMDVKMGEWNV